MQLLWCDGDVVVVAQQQGCQPGAVLGQPPTGRVCVWGVNMQVSVLWLSKRCEASISTCLQASLQGKASGCLMHSYGEQQVKRTQQHVLLAPHCGAVVVYNILLCSSQVTNSPEKPCLPLAWQLADVVAGQDITQF